MRKLDERGAVNSLLFPFVLVLLLFLGAAAFGIWAFAGRQDFRNNVVAKIATAQAATKIATQAADQKTYAEASKYPLRSYTGPSSLGGVTVSFPKTWSAFVQDDDSKSNTPINGYFQPNIVPDIGSSTFAFRMQLTTTPYAQQMAGYDAGVKQGTLVVAPYSLPKVPSVSGSIMTNTDGTGVTVVLPVRNMTLILWTEQPSEINDFTKIILPNASFAP